jgi:tRNA threonylcarbamoyl adenosine modification protein YjeE
MGVGKTTFTQKIVRAILGENTAVQSPTFTIINQYSPNIFHADLYRIKSQDELLNTDFLEILNKAEQNDTMFFIEWPFNNVSKDLYKSRKNVVNVYIDEQHKVTFK